MTNTPIFRLAAVSLAAAIIATSTVGCAAHSPGSSPTVTARIPADAPQTYEAAEKRANALFLALSELPAGNWRSGGPVIPGDIPRTICGINNVPQPPAGSFASRATHPTGAVLFQTVRPVGATQASQTVTELGHALEACTTDSRIVDGQTVSYDMARIQLSDPSVTAYRQNRSSNDQGMWTYVVYLAIGDSLVEFEAFRPSPEAPTAFLDSLVAAVRKKG